MFLFFCDVWDMDLAMELVGAEYPLFSIFEDLTSFSCLLLLFGFGNLGFVDSKSERVREGEERREKREESDV